MKLTPMRPMFRSFLVGMCVGFVFITGMTTWAALRHHEVAATAKDFAVAVVAATVLANVWFQSWLHRKTQAAEPMPADAEFIDGKRLKWHFVMTGVAAALIGGRGAVFRPVAWEGVIVGMVVGFLLATAFALRYVARWEDEHGRELLQRRGKGKGARYFFRDLDPSGTHRFTRRQETISTH